MAARGRSKKRNGKEVCEGGGFLLQYSEVTLLVNGVSDEFSVLRVII